MKKPNPRLKLPEHWRVAMVVTRAPSEPFEVVKNTLLAMKNQVIALKYDVWLADENPTDEIERWCDENDVGISTRLGIVKYHNLTWPRRTKCKEGNLAYFYDHYGYREYDFVAQLDADHIPEKSYLEEILKPFLNPEVGYVSAPSICDLNAISSWAARGRLFAEGALHGALQAGYSNNWAPLCINSHYAVRTEALKQIGGLGPELAEDHSTTLTMNAFGWKGVHAFDAIARGDGPATFADAMTQEFQWSRSLIVLLFTLTPKLIGKMPWHLRGQFLFAQMWYPLFASVMGLSFVLPLIAILTGQPWMNINYFEFLTFSTMPTVLSLIIMFWVSRNKWLRPDNSKVVSWEFVLFQFARWPWVMWATLLAIYGIVKRSHVEFKVTPKGLKEVQTAPLKMVVPYLVFSLISATIVLIGARNVSAAGYYYFGIINSLAYLLVAGVVIFNKSKA